MKRSALVISVAALSVCAAAPAQAVTVRPSTAPLVDSAGVDSGCDGTITGGDPAPDPNVGTPLEGAPGYITVKTALSCPHHWRAETESQRWQPVIDGVRGTTYTLGSGSSWLKDDQTPSPEPLETWVSTTINPCMTRTDGNIYYPGRSGKAWLLPLGMNDVILGGTTKVNEYKSDLHPYQAKVEKLVTVRCTKARAAYR
jgi:hypothetical protein